MILFMGAHGRLGAQELDQQQSDDILTEKGYTRAAQAIVKIVADSGRTTGAGIFVGLHEDGVGFILTSHSLVRNSSKVVVFAKGHITGLVGNRVDRWVDFDLDLAVIGVRAFPKDVSPAILGVNKSTKLNQPYGIIGHTEEGDWSISPAEVTLLQGQQIILGLRSSSKLRGAPVVNAKGYVLGLIIDDATLKGKETLASAVKSEAVKPILNEWFGTMPLSNKWLEKSAGLPSWIWAVGGGVLGGAAATVIALTGEADDGGRGLPRPPDPPPAGQ